MNNVLSLENLLNRCFLTCFTLSSQSQPATSLIDNIFTDNITCLSENGLIINDLFDHLPIFSIGYSGFDTLTKKERTMYMTLNRNTSKIFAPC